MSRCFPFPPPGYEKKPTLDEPDLLKKEKRKEKKHKKDKKDKEKRDGKEKREKDRSEGKHKEKKDKKDKDKHRDKKEKKSKSSNPDEKRVHGQFEGYNGEKVHPNDSTRSSSSSDKKQSLQFQNGEYHHDPIQRKEESSKEKNSSSDDKRSSIQFCGQNGEMVRNRIKATDTSENIKFVQELDRRIKNEEKGTGSHQFVVEGRKNSFNKIEIQKMDGRQSIMEEAGFGGRNATVQNKINGKTLPPFDNKIEKRIEQKEKMAEKDSDDKRGDKRKNKDRDKQRQGKDKDTEKEKKEEKAKEKSEQKRAEREKNKYIRKSESVANPNSFSAHPPENSFHGIGSEGNLKKRKDMETNGVSHENESRPNKMGRFSSNIAPENGRKLDSVQNSGSSLLDRQQGASQGASTNSFKMGSKGQRVNGMIDPPPVSASSKTPPFPAFNHIPAKPSPIKSPPVITNHVAAHQPPPAPTIKPHPPPVPNHIAAQPPPLVKPQPAVPNHIAAQPPPLVKPQPAVPNHIAAQPPPIKPQPAVPNHIAAQLPTPKPPPSIPNHIAARSPPLLSTPSTTAKQQPLSRPKPPPAVVNKAAPPPPLPLPKKKPPHPDTKYLNQILSVPKLDEWCGLDDQEWLFNRKEEYPCSSKKTTTMEVEENQVQVWSEAKHIESVDICALPYVIPY